MIIAANLRFDEVATLVSEILGCSAEVESVVASSISRYDLFNEPDYDNLRSELLCIAKKAVPELSEEKIAERICECFMIESFRRKCSMLENAERRKEMETFYNDYFKPKNKGAA